MNHSVITEDDDKQIKIRFETLLIRSMNVAGAFVKPKDITKNS